MKRLLSLAAMLLVCCVTLFAQQALWGGAAVVSPDIHDDNTVTFRLKAPKAVRVQITGDGPEQCLHDSGCGYRDQCIYHRW